MCAYLFEDPGVAVTVEPVGDLQFCGQPQRSLVVTVTNTGGPARELVLEVEKSGTFNLAPASPDWVQAGSVLSYTANGGVLLGGETITFTLDVDFTAQVCDQNSGSFVLRPVFRHACPLTDPPERGTQAEVELQSPVAPSLSIAKHASTDVLGTGRNRLLHGHRSRSQPHQHCHRASPCYRYAAGDFSRRHDRAQRLRNSAADGRRRLY